MEKIAFEVEVNASGAIVASKNFKQQLKEANIEAQKTALALGATSKEAINAAKKVALMKEELADVKDTIDALHPEAKLNAVTSAVSGIAGGFAAAEGAMALFGTQSEDVQKQLVKIQGALALSQGINQVLGMGDALRNLGIVIKATTVYQIAYNFVQNATTQGAKALRISMLAIPIVAIATGLALLWANFDKVKKIIGNVVDATEGAIKKFAFLDATVKIVTASFSYLWDMIKSGLQYVNILDDAEEEAAANAVTRSEERLAQFDKQDKARQRSIDLAKAQGATEDELRAMEINSLSDSLDAYLEFVNAKKKAGQSLTESEIEELAVRQSAYKIALEADSTADKEELAKRLKDETDARKKAQDKKNKDAEEAKKKLEEENKRILELQNQLQDELIKGIADSQEREIAELKVQFQRRIDAIVGNSELEKSLRVAIANNEEKAIAEVKDKYAKENAQKELDRIQAGYTDANASLQAKVLQAQENSAAFFQAERDLENQQFEQAMSDKTLSNGQRELLEAQHQKNLTDIDKSESQQRIQNQENERQAKLALAQTTLNGLSSLADLLSKNGKKNEAVQKSLALTQIAIDTAKAISSTIANAQTAASAGGPAAPFLSVIYTITGIAQVLAGMAQAKKALSGGNPSASTGSSGAPSANVSTSPINPVTTTQGGVTDTTGVRAQQTVKAIVVETDMTQSQKRVSSIQERATF